MNWTVANGGEPLKQLQRHPGSMYGGCHIATVDGVFQPRDPATGQYNIWYGCLYTYDYTSPNRGQRLAALYFEVHNYG